MSEDNLEPLVTQCPNCETRFRVTEAQLQVAQGRVRCGACLGVFDGTAYLTLDGETFDTPEDAEDVDRLLQELDLAPVPEAGLEDAHADADDVAETAAEVIAGASPSDPDMPDELLALEQEFLKELRAAQDDEALPRVAPLAATQRSSSAQPELPASADEELAADDDLSLDGVPEPATGATHAYMPAADRAPEPQPQEQSEERAAEPPQAAQQLEPAEEKEEDREEDQEIVELEVPAYAGLDSEASETPADADGGPSTTAAQKFRMPDLDIPELGETQEPRPRRSWVTVALIVLALIGLPAQILWFQYESWVKDARFRPIYVQICNVVGCELPPMRDVSQIVSKKSVIRVHPQRSDARIVDVLMVNNADFAQPFPLIELIATSIRGQLVAGRRFKPEEYLQGEMADAELLPPRTPVHVSLEIQDPGEDALSFEVRFR